MINVICISSFNELESIKMSVMDLGYKLIHKPFINVEFVSLSAESLRYIEESNVCVFQSKNAAISVKGYRNRFNDSTDYYAVGIFTAKSVEESIQFNCNYPKKNYSSNDLIKDYGFSNMTGKKIVILKGEGGLSIIKESLQEKNTVNEIIAYKRIINKNIIKAEDFDDNSKNVVICMSQDALKSLCGDYHGVIEGRDTILIIPSERFVSDQVKIFKEVYTLKSSNYKEEIINIIQNCNE
tara:strand:- start:3409 stop:4125 length:717 start_codon:yes stop_codon:yes gene_type:complete